MVLAVVTAGMVEETTLVRVTVARISAIYKTSGRVINEVPLAVDMEMVLGMAAVVMAAAALVT